MNGFVKAAERLAVVCFRSAAKLPPRSPAERSSSIRRCGAVDPDVPQRITWTARSDVGLLSDAVMVHRIHTPFEELHPNDSFLRSRSGRLFANAASVDSNHETYIITSIIYRVLSVQFLLL